MTWQGSKELTRGYLPKVIPDNWKILNTFSFEYYAYYTYYTFIREDGLKVIFGVEWQEEDPETKWLHVSMSFKSKLPTYQDMKIVKDIFIGEERTAFQIFPPKTEHINLHANCLHLFCCVTKDILPDFRREGGL